MPETVLDRRDTKMKVTCQVALCIVNVGFRQLEENGNLWETFFYKRVKLYASGMIQVL